MSVAAIREDSDETTNSWAIPAAFALSLSLRALRSNGARRGKAKNVLQERGDDESETDLKEAPETTTVEKNLSWEKESAFSVRCFLLCLAKGGRGNLGPPPHSFLAWMETGEEEGEEEERTAVIVMVMGGGEGGKPFGTPC